MACVWIYVLMLEFCTIIPIDANAVHNNANGNQVARESTRIPNANKPDAFMTRKRRLVPAFVRAMYTAPVIAPIPAALSNQLNVVASPLNISRAITGSRVVYGMTNRLEAASNRISDKRWGEWRR